MTSSGPAAEPSMEEILASIRRIISDGDDGAAHSDPAGGGAAPAAAAALAPAPAAPVAPEPAPARAAAQDPAPRPQAEASPAAAHQATAAAVAPQPATEETVADAAPTAEEDDIFELTDAMLEEEPAVDEALASPPDVLAQSRPPAPPEAQPETEPDSPPDPQSAAEADIPLVDPPEPEVEFGSEPQGEAQPSQPPGLEAPSTVAGANGAAPPPGGATVDNDQLLSPATNAKVAAAFGQLAGTIMMKDARTLDDLVQEMLRPMLKEWLDDNLPQLVERLVREEIERVSRGRS